MVYNRYEKMKKLFLMLFVMAGICFGANAQMCKSTGNVEYTIESGSNTKEISVKLHNYNEYKVTVTVTAKIVNNKGVEVDRQRTVVVQGKGSSEYKEKIVSFRGKGDGDVVVNECSVSIYVEKCE